MFFDEARSLNQLHYTNSKVCNHGDFTQEQSISTRNDKIVSRRLATSDKTSPEAMPVKAAEMLDSANNRLQELMQLLYLLSRDPGVPNDARYHVTVAQSEIALLAREMRNTAESQTSTSAGPNLKSFTAAQP